MAARFWVGGTGALDGATTTHIAATSGGAGGASYPTSADDLIFDSLSNPTAYTVTVTGTLNCANLTFGAPAAGNVTWAGSTPITVFGNFALYAGLIRTFTGLITFAATTPGKTITFAGTNLTSNITWNGVGGGWTLQDALIETTFLSLTLLAGALDFNGKTVTVPGGGLSVTGALTRSLTFGAAIVSATLVVSGSGYTISAAAASIILQGGTPNLGAGNAYGTIAITGSCTFITSGATMTALNITSTTYSTVFLSDNIVVGTLTVAGGNASTQRVYIVSSNPLNPRTITAGAVVLSNADFEDIVGAGAAAWTGTLLGNGGGNSGITFDAPISCFWVHDATASHAMTDARWFTASGGATPARFPLVQDTAVFDALSFPATGKTVTLGIALRVPTLDWSAATNAPTLTWIGGGAIYGSFSAASSMTVTAGSLLMLLRGRGSNTIRSNGVTIGLRVYVDAFGGTVTLLDAINTGAFQLGLNRGTFNAAGFNVTTDNFESIAGSLACTLLMGSGTWTITGLIWNCGNSSGLTVTAGTSTILMNNASATVKSFAAGGKSYNNLTLAGGGAGTFDFTVGANTFTGTLAIGAQSVRFGAGTTTTVANLTSSPGAVIGSITAANHNIVKTGGGTIFLSGVTISRSQASPANTFYAVASSTNGGNNTGWYFGEFVTPAVADAITESVAPAVILGSIVVTPGVVDAITATVTPTAVLGSISITPAAADAIPETFGALALSSFKNLGRPTRLRTIKPGPTRLGIL